MVEADLGARLDDVFTRVLPTPLAAASIAQVHAATLRTGEEVVVKVQRPSVAKLVHHDLKAMSWLAPLLVGRIPVASLANPPALVELFAETIVEELDFRCEAANMVDIAAMLRELGNQGYVVPRPHPTLVTRRVLVMQRVDGFNFDDVAGMKDAGVDTEEVVRTAMVALMEGAMIYGVFHGDLHGGNLFVLPDGRTALLDFGIVGRLTQATPPGVPAADAQRHHQRPGAARWRRCATLARCLADTDLRGRASAICASTSRWSTPPRSPARSWWPRCSGW